MAHETANALSSASSAYLRSAMHQPVRWREWGPEAFAIAQRENKPILLDIGAVWCHWCHVMDRESYESAEVARIINENFVAIKVDRDERPDVDSRYQAAVSAISGQGGWPLTAFLTPDGKPFYGGTYFPPEEHYGRPGFKGLLLAIAEAYRQKHAEVVESASNVMTAISHAEGFTGRAGSFSPAVIDAAVDSAAKLFDIRNGGFGNAPKFPHPAVLDLLLDRHARGGPPFLETMIHTTLEKMARGGVYDHIGGGFHRYSVDERWVVPHFEKMCYDNSELLKNYVHAFQVTGKPLYAEVARDIIRWVDEWLSDRERGGFYASQDADIDLEDDGNYFTWTLAEARAVLDDAELSVAALYYDIGETGEMHHDPARNVLRVKYSFDEVAQRLTMERTTAETLLASAKNKMEQARRQRKAPYIDKTVYVSWNAMFVSAYLQAARALQLDDARRFALRSLDRILAEAWNAEQGLARVIAYSDPAAVHRRTPGLLDDYAFTVLACLDAYEATADLSYFNFARRIADRMLQDFYDAISGGFFDVPGGNARAGETPETLGALSARRKPFQDSPTPAGNPAAAIALLRLHGYTHHDDYRDRAEQTLEVFAGVAKEYGIFAATYAIAAIWMAEPATQVVIIGSDDKAEQLATSALAPFALNKAVLRLPENEAIAQNLPPALAETIPNLPAVHGGKTTAVICSGFACQPPVHEPGELTEALRQAVSSERRA